MFVTEQGDQASEPHTVSFGLTVCVGGGRGGGGGCEPAASAVRIAPKPSL